MNSIDKKFKAYDFLMSVALFIYLIYPYNFSLMDKVIVNQKIIICIYIIAGILMLIANINYIKKNNSTVIKLIVMLSLIALVIFRNGDIAEGHYSLPFFTTFTIYSIFILSFTDRWYKIAIKLISFFTIEHILATLFCYLFPSFYYNNILILFPDYSRELIYQFKHHQIAGITHHYSTNALYLVVGLILLSFNKNIFKNKMCHKVLFVLNSIALLMTGKRAQVVFFIISLVLIILYKNRKNAIKAFSKILFGTIALFCVVIVASFAIPTISNSFTRAYDSLNDSNSMSSREVLYEVAINQFKDNKMFGIGWGKYRYVYNNVVVNKERDYLQTHCIYLQLLCEVGITGFLIVIFVFERLVLKNILLINRMEKDIVSKDKNMTVNNSLYFCLLFTIYFLLEGCIGNSIYDKQIFMPYALIISYFLYLYNDLKKVGKI